MKRKVLESELRQVLKDPTRFPSGAVSFSEPGLGSDFGLPDAWIAKAPCWLPVELKRGNSVVAGLRPSQRLWHRNSLSLGIPTYGMTLRQDEMVSLVALQLSGGFNGELSEIELCRESMAKIELGWFLREIR